MGGRGREGEGGGRGREREGGGRKSEGESGRGREWEREVGRGRERERGGRGREREGGGRKSEGESGRESEEVGERRERETKEIKITYLFFIGSSVHSLKSPVTATFLPALLHSKSTERSSINSSSSSC